MIRYLWILTLLLWQNPLQSQEMSTLSLEEYLAYVKKHHPIVKQADLIISESQAKLLKARGAFDPKIEVDYASKEFKGTNYYNQLNSVFKIPTWYGVELKAAIEENSGDYLNPNMYTSDNTLYQIGAELALAKGLLINERMATLKQAKLYRSQAVVDNQIAVNEILSEATLTYFNWLRAYKEQLIYQEFVVNAQNRLLSIEKNVELGENPAIDITEAKIAYNNRNLSSEKAKLKYLKASLMLSNFLWIDNIPLELKGSTVPDLNTEKVANSILGIEEFSFDTFLIDQHPKLQSLDYKRASLKVEKNLQLNNLLPTVNLKYNFLNQTTEIFNNLNPENYKAGVQVQLPLFLRKERAALKLANFKLKANEYDQLQTQLSLKNKITAIEKEIESYSYQLILSNEIVSDYQKLLQAEQRKFELGESALFYIITRESKLIENQLKAIDAEYNLLVSKGKLFNVLSLI
jgi:outer membrane protein TolC